MVEVTNSNTTPQSLTNSVQYFSTNIICKILGELNLIHSLLIPFIPLGKHQQKSFLSSFTLPHLLFDIHLQNIATHCLGKNIYESKIIGLFVKNHNKALYGTQVNAIGQKKKFKLLCLEKIK